MEELSFWLEEVYVLDFNICKYEISNYLFYSFWCSFNIKAFHRKTNSQSGSGAGYYMDVMSPHMMAQSSGWRVDINSTQDLILMEGYQWLQLTGK